jgi:hypothetical protein
MNKKDIKFEAGKGVRERQRVVSQICGGERESIVIRSMGLEWKGQRGCE